jgi:hypothetical protein
MTDYPLDMQLVVDPLNPENVVRDGDVYLYDPSDLAGVSPIAIKDPSGLPLTNPLKSNAYGFTRPCIVTIPRVKWKSGMFEGFFYSYDGLRNEAIAAKVAAQDSATAASNSAALVGAPADAAIAAAVNGTGITRTALNAAFVPKWKPTTAYLAGDAVLSPAGDTVTAKVNFTSGASYSAANWNLSPTYALKEEAGKVHTITNAAIAYAPRATLETIPTYDGSGVVVHPSVYFNPDGWNGKKYWMAMTPYSSANSALENPSIVVSDDGNTWTVPAGLTNPVVAPYPNGSANGYNSDPFLFLDGATMYLFWRTWDGYNNRDRHYYRTSTDGINWAAAVMIRDDVPTDRRLVAPSYIKDSTGWTMYAVDILPVPRKFVRAKAATLAGIATATVENVTITGNTGEPWHVDVHKVGGEWQALVQDGGSGGGKLWAAMSNDGLNFTAGPEFIARTAGQWDALYYKSCFVPAVKDGLAGWDAWIGGASFVASGNIVGRTFVRFDQLRLDVAAVAAELAVARGDTSVIQALNGLPPWLVGDSFARADNATALGNANTGQTWTASSGSWKILTKAAQGQAAANNIATIETGVADHWANVTLTYPDTTGTKAIVARYADSSNFYRFGTFAGVLKLQKIVAGAATDLATPAGTVASGMTLGIRCVGSSINLYVGGLLVATVTDAALATGTKVGIQESAGTSRFTMFTARTA